MAATIVALQTAPRAIKSAGILGTHVKGPAFSSVSFAGIHRKSHMKGSTMVIRASAEESSDSNSANTFGLGGPGTFFGFGERQELNVGRLAMVGFASALVMEVITGKGVFGQLGVDPISIRLPFLAGLSFLLVGGLLGGYVVINSPPDVSKAPANAGDGIPRNPFDKSALDPQTTYTRGAIAETPEGKKLVEPFVSDLKE